MTYLIARIRLRELIAEALESDPVVALLGARQVGKTRLARLLDVPESNYFDLEKTRDALRLDGDAFGVLDSLRGIVVIDEVQRMPNLFPLLRVLADRDVPHARFVITGSVAPETIQGVSESLAGRAALIRMGGLTVEEVTESAMPISEEPWRRLWLQGAMPDVYRSDPKVSFRKRDAYLDLLINRDLLSWGGPNISPTTMWKLLVMLADNSAQVWNQSTAARELAVEARTVRQAVDILAAAFLVRELPPFLGTARKRLRKAPKIVFRDTGLMHGLLGIRNQRELEMHHRYGFSWETFCIDQIIRMTETADRHCFSWTVDSGPEVDLVLDRPDGRFGFEFKASSEVKVTPSMKKGIEEMGLDRLFVVNPGDIRYMMGAADLPIEAVGIDKLADLCTEIRER